MAAIPGFAQQSRYRTFFRVAGCLVFAVGLVLTIIGFGSLLSTMGSDSMDMPSHFFLAFIGMPVMAVGAWLLQAGFFGAAARYAAGETMPVVRDSASYLTNGEGIFGIGRDAAAATPETGPFCSRCGVRNDVDARFCDACGNSLSGA